MQLTLSAGLNTSTGMFNCINVCTHMLSAWSHEFSSLAWLHDHIVTFSIPILIYIIEVNPISISVAARTFILSSIFFSIFFCLIYLYEQSKALQVTRDVPNDSLASHETNKTRLSLGTCMSYRSNQDEFAK